MIPIKSAKQVGEQINQVASDYLREPSDRTLGYLQLLLNYYDMCQKAIYSLNPLNSQYIVAEMGLGRTDALEWLHDKTVLYHKKGTQK